MARETLGYCNSSLSSSLCYFSVLIYSCVMRQVLPHPPPPNVHYHKPWVLDYGCHHGKMMLLFWKGTPPIHTRGHTRHRIGG